MDEMGYQLVLMVGTEGSAATTVVTQATDVDYDLAIEKGSTTVRGTGGNVPIKTGNAVLRAAVITWTMINDPTDSVLGLMINRAITGNPLAVKLVTGSGATLFDGDCIVGKKYNAPLGGEGTYDFTAEPTKKSGRSPTLG